MALDRKRGCRDFHVLDADKKKPGSTFHARKSCGNRNSALATLREDAKLGRKPRHNVSREGSGGLQKVPERGADHGFSKNQNQTGT